MRNCFIQTVTISEQSDANTKNGEDFVRDYKYLLCSYLITLSLTNT